jgi:hypothetical protein
VDLVAGGAFGGVPGKFRGGRGDVDKAKGDDLAGTFAALPPPPPPPPLGGEPVGLVVVGAEVMV